MKKSGYTLIINVGNSNTIFGLFADDKFVSKWRMETTKGRTADEYGTWLLTLFDYTNIRSDFITGAIISSVVPSVDLVLTSMCRRFFKCEPLHVVPGIKTGMRIHYGRSGDLGPDRLANIVALKNLYDKPCMVVDFGTTTSFDIVNEEGDYVGGVVSPGVSLALSALSSAAPQLPEVGLDKPKDIIGKNIVHSMQAGCYFGAVDMITGLITRLWNAIEVDSGTCIATGGFAKDMVEDLNQFGVIDPNLTLKGLKFIYDKNQKD
jgi:type III pantothenate kinase